MSGHARARSLAALIAALVACKPDEGSRWPPYVGDQDSAGDTAADTGETGDTGWDGPCPPDMVQVSDVLCVDAVEATITGDLGNADQGAAWPDGSTTATAEAVVGVVPTIHVSWYQAVAACENAGKRLCTVDEWHAACSTGSTFPWGEEPVPAEVCAVPTSAGDGAWDELQPTGSLPECVSPLGVFDQMGNAWEWADGGVDDDGLPVSAKLGGAHYAGGGDALCLAAPNLDHTPGFDGTIAARCCTDAH